MRTTVKLTLDGLIEALRLKSGDLARGMATSRRATETERRTRRPDGRRTETKLPEDDDELWGE